MAYHHSVDDSAEGDGKNEQAEKHIQPTAASLGKHTVFTVARVGGEKEGEWTQECPVYLFSLLQLQVNILAT